MVLLIGYDYSRVVHEYLHIKYSVFFLFEIFQVVKHAGSDQLHLLTRMMQGSMQDASHFSSHPAAAGTFFTLLLFGLKLCNCLHERDCTVTFGANLLHDRIYRFAQFSESR